MKSFKIILILIFILILDIIFTKSYQFYKSIEFSKDNYMALNNTYHHELKKIIKAKVVRKKLFLQTNMDLFNWRNNQKLILKIKKI